MEYFVVKCDMRADMTYLLDEKLLSLLLHVREQNNQILEILNKNKSTLTDQFLPEDIPISLPLDNNEDLLKLETYLSETNNAATLTSHLSRLGGRDIDGKINLVLKRCLTNKLAPNFSFYGKRQEKKAFCELRLMKVILSTYSIIYAIFVNKIKFVNFSGY
ncbi:hypothetical protein NQ314_003534 [Rhamnusium bicolor]|uniref:DUF4806 domain-containing protein n=1 Tax=Rhamnusium bicolor TaxID=1586634 RepID=A0AAV8ZP41_9CUCU|nr:hypothetical protein NQ314_003534 [Rhamnusium bicolor]